MVLYNVTVGIDLDVEEEWKQWMLKKHIPEIMASGMFEKYEMYKILTQEEEGPSYSIQYYAKTMSDVEKYLSDFAPKLIRKHMDRYKNKHVAFRSLLEQVG